MLNIFKLLSVAFIVSVCFNGLALGQEVPYFHKIEDCAAVSKRASVLLRKIDSIKQTRRQQDSKTEILFSRDIDFGYKHERIEIVYNSIYYQVNLIVKNDSICFSSVLFDTDLYNDGYKKYNAIKIDTIECLHYLKVRNNFYRSSKTIADIAIELNLNEDFAFYCGDGMPKTNKGKRIEELAKNLRIKKLSNMLASISCEEQAYGYAGLEMTEKKGYKLPPELKEQMFYLKKRNSELLECSGCFAHQLQKEFTIQ